MFLMFLVFTEVFFSILYLYFARFYIFVFCALIYFVFFYRDDSEKTGNRSWTGFRSLRLWDNFNAVTYDFVNREALINVGDKRMYFVVMNNQTNMSLISGFGFHGTLDLLRKLEIRYVLPQVLFKIPGLREVLLWSGAIAKSSVLEMLKMGRSVVECPFGMTSGDSDSSDQSYKLDDSVFAYALKNKLFLVPVIIENELSRYTVYNGNFVQRWMYEKYGYPFTFFFYPNVFGNRPPKRMSVQIGHPMDPSLQENVSEFERVFMGQVNSMKGIGV